MIMKFLIAVVAAIVSLAGVCGGGNAVSGKAGMSTAEAIAAYEGTAEGARDPAEKEVESAKGHEARPSRGAEQHVGPRAGD